MQGLTNGRIVHYVMQADDYTEEGCYAGSGRAHHRPAIVVENWGNDKGDSNSPAVNLIIFADAPNDGHPSGTFCRTSVCYSEGKEPGTWHWPEKY